MTRWQLPQQGDGSPTNQAGPLPLSDCLLEAMTKYYRHAAVGRRLTGLIHALNSPLQVLLMQADLIDRKLQEEEAVLAPQLPAEAAARWREYFAYRQRKNQQLAEMAEKLQELINWLRYRTVHEDQHGPQEIDLNEMVRTELQGYQMESFFKNRVVKRRQQEEQLPPITGYYIDFSQSFCHLVDNALEALQEVPEPVLTITTRVEDGQRVIAVGDNGPGIPLEVQPNLFLPFYTTKHTSATPHAGLGLFLAQKLLRPYGGRVTVTSQPGQTWFRLILP